VKTRELIDLLVADQSTTSLKPRNAFAVTTATGALVTAVILVMLIGVRPDLAAALSSLRFIMKVVVVLVLAAAAIGATVRLSRPDGSPGHWKWGLVAAFSLLVAAVAGELVAIPAWQWEARLLGANWLDCLALIPVLAIPPLIGLFIALRHAAPSDAGYAGAVAGVAAGGIAATIYAAHCPDDSPLFVAAWYTIAIGIVSLCGFLAGRRWLAW
jgi:hypothetical protein